MNEERWRPIPGFEGLYSVSDHGRVRAEPRSVRRTDGRVQQRVGGILAPGAVQSGHLMVTLCRDGSRDRRRVHRLVLEAFVGPNPPGTEGCHNDGDPTNNRLENLRWDTVLANKADRERHGRTARGERHGRSKLTVAQVAELRRLRAAGATQTSLAERFGISQPHVSAICRGDFWSSSSSKE